MEYTVIAEAIMKAKELEQLGKTLGEAIKMLEEAGSAANSLEFMRKEQKAYELAVMTYQDALAVPLEIDFVAGWQSGEYGRGTLREAVREHYDAFLEEHNAFDAGTEHAAFVPGTAVTQGTTYSYNGQLWKWVDGDSDACVWIPGTTGVWQWQLVE